MLCMTFPQESALATFSVIVFFCQVNVMCIAVPGLQTVVITVCLLITLPGVSSDIAFYITLTTTTHSVGKR